MVTYQVITKYLKTKDELELFLKSFGEVVQGGYGEWSVKGAREYLQVNLYSFEECFDWDSILVRDVLNSKEEALVISIPCSTSRDEPLFFDFLATAVNWFGGFVDFEGEIVEQIYSASSRSYDGEGNVVSHYILPAKSVDYSRFLRRRGYL